MEKNGRGESGVELLDKLTILADAAKYDAACTSSGLDRSARPGGLGSTMAAGCCHTFSWYLSQNLPKVEDARILVENGYAFYLIAENADAGEAAFHAHVEAQTQA